MNSRLHNHVCSVANGTRGGFAAKLADAWLAADSGNQAALNKAFPRIFQAPSPTFGEYKDFVRDLANSTIPANFEHCEIVLKQWVKLAKGLADAETLP